MTDPIQHSIVIRPGAEPQRQGQYRIGVLVAAAELVPGCRRDTRSLWLPDSFRMDRVALCPCRLSACKSFPWIATVVCRTAHTFADAPICLGGYALGDADAASDRLRTSLPCCTTAPANASCMCGDRFNSQSFLSARLALQPRSGRHTCARPTTVVLVVPSSIQPAREALTCSGCSLAGKETT